MNSPKDRSAGTTGGDEIEWLYSLQRFGIKPGLETTEALLAAVGLPADATKVVLVAGTNGKGSVATVLAACLQAAGHRTGLFISPHLQRLGERARVDGVEATPEELRRALALVRPHATRLDATFFEVVMVAALLRFRAADVEWAVMEVGLGGRFDATNALEPSLSLITSVGLDHMAVLGPDIAAIATEKAGILRPGVPALTSTRGEALEAVENRARELGTPLLVVGRDVEVQLLSHGWDGISLSVGPLTLRSPLLGVHQAENVALAALAALHLGVDGDRVSEAVAAATWPGRLEVLEFKGRRFVLDGAHNPQAAQALATTLRRLGAVDADVAAAAGSAADLDAGAAAAAGIDVLILGLSADKDSRGVVEPLAGLADRVIATRARLSPRAADPRTLAVALLDAVPELDVVVALDPVAALERALRLTGPGATVVVAGSLFLVGEFRTLLTGESSEPAQRWQ